MNKNTMPCLVSILLLAGCQPLFIDYSREIDVNEIKQILAGTYLGIAWVEQNTMILYSDENSVVNQHGLSEYNPKIEVLNTASGLTTPIDIKTDCIEYFIRGFKTLPNHNAGYILSCPSSGWEIIQNIDMFNEKTDGFYTESSDMWIGDYSYSTNMKELILVNILGGRFFSSELYYLNEGKKAGSITPDFLRADFPSWSPQTDIVAFFGNKSYPVGDEQIENFSDITNRLDYPWKLYLYDTTTASTQELPLEVVGPTNLVWSPNGKLLAFSGNYKGAEGIWIVSGFDNPESLTMNRMTTGLATFDFSPDGKSIAFAYVGLRNTEKQNIVYVINLPNQE